MSPLLSSLPLHPGTSVSETTRFAEHLFRRKYGEILAALLHTVSYENFEIAEEAVQTAFQRALEKWPFSGVPENPPGWLYQVARNAAVESLRRKRTEAQKLQQIKEEVLPDEPHPDFAKEETNLDEVATMILLCCNPEISPKAQVCLTLKAACGFSVTEISNLVGMTEEATKKTITRAKERFGSSDGTFEALDPRKITDRFSYVLETLYAMFTEAYAASSGESQLRRDVAEEALYLGDLFLHSAITPQIRTSELHALIALMLFQMARFDARSGEDGIPLRLQEQDRGKWNAKMIQAGLTALEASKSSPQPTSYHLEARIAAVHATSTTFETTDWKLILSLYDQLLLLKDSLEVRLSRIVATRHARGVQVALSELEEFESAETSSNNTSRSFLLNVMRAEFLDSSGRGQEAHAIWGKALESAPTLADRRFVELQIKKSL